MLGEAGASGYEYLDKIVQIPFLIPRATDDELKGFLSAEMPLAAAPAPPPGEDGDGLDGSAVTATDGLGDFSAPRRPLAGTGAPDPPEDGAAVGVAKGDEDRPTFDEAELDAFQGLTPFMRSNPRHIKRLINVYRLVRTLAIRGRAPEIAQSPKATIAWIVLCAQWPYTVSLMLRAFEPLADAVDSGEGEFPTGEPLRLLYNDALPTVQAKHQSAIDDEVAVLDRLLSAAPMTWDQLRALRTYTLNFNPAIERALHG